MVTKESEAKRAQCCYPEGVNTESGRRSSVCKDLQGFYSEKVIIGKNCLAGLGV